MLNLKLDDDVMNENARIAQLGPKDTLVRVNELRKVYTTLLGAPSPAVELSSFSLDYGEVFGLLGVNGAGKTTTFKSLVG